MNVDMRKIEELVGQVLAQIQKEQLLRIPVGVSNRHVHVSQADLEALFGEGYSLTKLKALKQTGQYAAAETVDLIGPKGVLTKVRILGPVRKATQVEISQGDSFTLGLRSAVRESGDLSGTAGVVLRGPRGEVTLTQGVIIALRHIHMPESTARQYGFHNGQEVAVIAESQQRKTTFHQVLIRVTSDAVLEMHVDVEEANAALLTNEMQVVIADQKESVG